MKHHSTGRRGLFFKINARKKGIALILIVSLALPYVSTAFLEQYEQHRSHQAAEQLQEKLQLSLDEQNAALDHFSELVTQSNYDEALDEINHLLALDSANPQYYLKRAGLYVLLNRSDEAMADLETTIRLAPNLYDARQLRAQLLEENGKYAEARTDYETMYQIDPSQTDVLMYIADCYQQQMDYENAITAYNNAEKALPEYADAIAYARGVCRYSLEDFEGALADFQKYAVAKPEDGELNFLIGSSYMNLEQEEAAESYLRKAYEQGAYLAECNFYLGSISMNREDYKTAIPYFTAAIEGNCFADFAFYNRGVCYLHTDEASLAKADFEYVMEHSTDSQLMSDTKDILDQLSR